MRARHERGGGVTVLALGAHLGLFAPPPLRAADLQRQQPHIRSQHSAAKRAAERWRRFRRRRSRPKPLPGPRLLAESNPSSCPHIEWWSCRRCQAPAQGSGTPGCQTWKRSGRSTDPARQERPGISCSTALSEPRQPRWAGEARPSWLGRHGGPLACKRMPVTSASAQIACSGLTMAPEPLAGKLL